MSFLTFWKGEVAERNGDILGYFLLRQMFYTFTKISSFIVEFVILGFKKWFYVDVLDFQIEFHCWYFGNWGLGNCLGYFFKIWPTFQIFWSLCLFVTKFVRIVGKNLVTLGFPTYVWLRCSTSQRQVCLALTHAEPQLQV